MKQADNKDFRNILLDDRILSPGVQVEHDKSVNWNVEYTPEQRNTLKRVAIKNFRDELDYGNFRHLFKIADTVNVNKDATKYGTVIWSTSEITQRLALYGLPRDSPLSVLCVEILPHITNVFEHVSGLDREEVRNKIRTTVGSTNFPSDGEIIEGLAVRKRAAQSVSFDEDRPLSNKLGDYRILRTSPLMKVSFVCRSE